MTMTSLSLSGSNKDVSTYSLRWSVNHSAEVCFGSCYERSGKNFTSVSIHLKSVHHWMKHSQMRHLKCFRSCQEKIQEVHQLFQARLLITEKCLFPPLTAAFCESSAVLQESQFSREQHFFVVFQLQKVRSVRRFVCQFHAFLRKTPESWDHFKKILQMYSKRANGSFFVAKE